MLSCRLKINFLILSYLILCIIFLARHVQFTINWYGFLSQFGCRQTDIQTEIQRDRFIPYRCTVFLRKKWKQYVSQEITNTRYTVAVHNYTNARIDNLLPGKRTDLTWGRCYTPIMAPIMLMIDYGTRLICVSQLL